jgi:hypothetical protein
MYRRPFRIIMSIKEAKQRSSCYKLYRYVCSEQTCTWNNTKWGNDYSYRWLSGNLDTLQQKTGLSRTSVIKARNKLRDMGLLRVEDVQIQAVSDVGFPVTTDDPASVDMSSLENTYFPVPKISMLSNIFCEKWSGTTALIYDFLCEEANRRGTNMLHFKRVHFIEQISRNTLKAEMETLGIAVDTDGQETGTGFIEIRRNADSTSKDTNGITVEMLNPLTSERIPYEALNAKYVDKRDSDIEDADDNPCEDEEDSYFVSESGARRPFSQLTPQHIEEYFSKTLPQGDSWRAGTKTQCSFCKHPSMALSINREGWWHCWKCEAGGKKLVTFEMNLSELKGESITKQQAWKRVLRKLNLKVIDQGPKSNWTSVHTYYDADSNPVYEIRRYKNLTTGKSEACLFRYSASRWIRGLANTKRILYNLPEVIKAKVVLLVEGEKKADILRSLTIRDRDGEHVAVTTSGGSKSWTEDDKMRFTDCLRRKRVILLPDTDEVGEIYRDRVEASLARAEIEYRVIEFPGCKDFRDFIDFKRDYGIPGSALTRLRSQSRYVEFEYDPEVRTAKDALVEFIDNERDFDWLYTQRVASLIEEGF